MFAGNQFLHRLPITQAEHARSFKRVQHGAAKHKPRQGFHKIASICNCAKSREHALSSAPSTTKPKKPYLTYLSRCQATEVFSQICKQLMCFQKLATHQLKTYKAAKWKLSKYAFSLQVRLGKPQNGILHN